MADDWQVGDLAVCIQSGEETRSGATYTVSDVKMPGEWRNGTVNRTGRVLLSFVGLPPRFAGDWAGAERFRKIRPDAQRACEEEFVTLLKRSKRKVSA